MFSCLQVVTEFMRLPRALTVIACAIVPSTMYGQGLVPREVSIEPVFTIGDDAGNAPFYFGRITGVVAVEDGRIYVMDGLECNVKVFDRAGKYVRVFGRAGSGPGEFNCSASLHIEAGSLQLFDGIQRRIATFTLDGKHIKTVSLPELNDEAVSRRLRHDWVLKPLTRIVTLGTRPTYDPYQYVVLQNATTKKTDTIAKLRLQFVLGSPSKDEFGRAIVSGFGDGGAWAVSGDSLVATVDGYEGLVRWYLVSPSGSRLIRTDRLGRTGAKVTPADVRAMESRIAVIPRWLGAKLTLSGWPTQWSVATRAFFTSDGALWVGGPDIAAKTIVWIRYPMSGMPIKVEVPENYWLLSARGDRLFGRTTTRLGSPTVVVYRFR